jgi:UDP-N-acetylglucosamine--N-acetylmuramyl-(pentapeptide) pyrophosphoryl-undecaprenol N-acetylglucosamine transferase
MKIAIVAGGTGGHIYPGIAVAQEIKRRDKDAAILFLGSEEGMEKDLVTREGFALCFIKARALLRTFSYKALSAPFISFVGFLQSILILKKFRPNLLLSTGGYTSLPAVLAARLLGIPIILQEQNALPGAVNRINSRFAKEIFISFKESLRYLPGKVLGNPVRRQIYEAQRDPSRRKFGFNPDDKVVLVMGGSQGAKRINESVVYSLANLPDPVKIMHIIGKRDFDWVTSYLGGKTNKNYIPISYLYDMSEALAAADLVVSRAGATAIAEFLARKLPMILVPFPYAAQDHQRLNAEILVKDGAAILIKDSDFSPERFTKLLNETLSNYDKMKSVLNEKVMPNAAERIVDYIYAQA